MTARERYRKALDMCEEEHGPGFLCGECAEAAILAHAEAVRGEAANICTAHILISYTTQEAHSQAQGNATALDCAAAIRTLQVT